MPIIFPKIDLNNVKGVLIDIDDTLYDYQSCHTKAMESCYQELYQKINNITFEEFDKKYCDWRNIVIESLKPQGACRSRLFTFKNIFEEMNLSNNWSLALQ